MIDADEVSAVLVTRGDVPLDRIEASIREAGISDIVVWDNSVREDVIVYGRYRALEEVENAVVLVQDDDVVLAPEAFETLLAEYEPGVLVANMPEIFRHSFYVEHCLVGLGAIFDTDLPLQAFGRLDQPHSEWFYKTCDIAFTTLVDRKLVDVPYEELPYSHAPNRMHKQGDHLPIRQQMLDLALAVRDRLRG